MDAPFSWAIRTVDRQHPFDSCPAKLATCVDVENVTDSLDLAGVKDHLPARIGVLDDVVGTGHERAPGLRWADIVEEEIAIPDDCGGQSRRGIGP